MISVNVVEIELTSLGELADVVVDKSFDPQPGMMLMDDESQIWEVTGTMHNAQRVLNENHTRLWTFQCKPVNANRPMQTGMYKLIH